MKKLTIVALLLALVTLIPATAQADEITGWDNIRPLLKDGAGDEFVRSIEGLTPTEFSADTEFQAVQAAASWVAQNMNYVADVGEVWTPSNDQYFENPSQGDCEDYAILLCSILRFHTRGGIPADRVWVTINLVTEPGAGVVAGHAWVGYKLERGGLAYIEPQTGNIYRGRAKGMLTFNDQWVSGGGRYLAGH